MSEISGVSEAITGAKPETKTPWEDKPLDHKWLESKLFPPGTKGPIKSEATRGYSHFSKISIPLAEEFKIHLQPKRQFVPLVAYKLAQLLQDESTRELVTEFKVQTDPESVDGEGQEMPQIVIYPKDGRENARKLLEILKQALQDEEKYGTGKPPRYNMRVNDLLFLAQSGGDLKTSLAGAGLLDEYFDKATGYAFMNGERKYWQDLALPSTPKAQELSPQEYVEQAQIMLEVAQVQKAQRRIKWDDKRFAALEIIRQRLARGETIDQIIVKSAANLRARVSKIGLK